MLDEEYSQFKILKDNSEYDDSLSMFLEFKTLVNSVTSQLSSIDKIIEDLKKWKKNAESQIIPRLNLFGHTFS